MWSAEITISALHILSMRMIKVDLNTNHGL
jgi:hypothetical protein